jgi:myosin protein heavy chain
METPDLTLLPVQKDDKALEDVVLKTLEARLLGGQIYTAVNAMLIAVNPCEQIAQLYSDETLRRYLKSADNSLPPHVYRTAARAYRGVHQGNCQSVVISGESGAGKTESFKRVIQLVSGATANAALSSDSHTSSIEAVLLDTVPMLESFGNASTVHNPNSSRFGKFVMLHFDEAAKLAGVHIKTYMLERSRAVCPGAGERSFHVFYELLRGGDPELLSECHLADGRSQAACRYLPAESFSLPVPRDDREEMGCMQLALAAADVPLSEVGELCYAMLCYATLRYATLCYATLRYATLCYAMLCYAMLCYAKLCSVRGGRALQEPGGGGAAGGAAYGPARRGGGGGGGRRDAAPRG